MSVLWVDVVRRAAFVHAIYGGGHRRTVSLVGQPHRGDRISTSDGVAISNFSISIYEGTNPISPGSATLADDAKCFVRITLPAPTFEALAWLDLDKYKLRLLLEVNDYTQAWKPIRESALEWDASRNAVELSGVSLEVIPCNNS